MAYELNKTDGTILTNLIDGQVDQDSTNLTLVGRNYTGYGEFFNENFIRLLENFSNTAAPSTPMTGQLWWNTESQRLQVYDGAQWKASGGPFVQNTRPQMVAGDLWINNETQQVFAYDGNSSNDLILLGPDYTRNQGQSGFEVESILDVQSRARTIIKFYIGGNLAGVYSNVEFTPQFSRRITELVTVDNTSGTILKGFNVVDKQNFKWHGLAESATALVTATGEVVTAAQFLPSDQDGVTTGTLTVQNSGGLTIGLSQNNVQKVVGPRFYIENQIRDHELNLRVRSSAFESLVVDAIKINAENARVGIFTTDRDPEYTLDVEGDLRVTGDLLVEGDTTSVNVSKLTVEDINIELGTVSDSTLGDDTIVENGGLILKSSDSDKNWTWKNNQNAWTSNVNIDLDNITSVYKINGSTKLTNTSLTNITTATDLTEIGTLDFLNVGNISIGEGSPGISSNEIRHTGANLLLSSDFSIKLVTGVDTVTENEVTIDPTQKIYGVTTPISSRVAAAEGSIEDSDDHVATKEYTDKEIATETIVFSMDVTGLGVGTTLQNNVKAFLDDLYPAQTEKALGKIAKIHTTSYSGATVEGVDIESAKNITFIDVDADGTLNESAVQDVTFIDATGNVILVPSRAIMTYKIVDVAGNQVWNFESTTTYP